MEAKIDFLNLRLFLCHQLRGGLCGLPLFLFNQFKHVVRPIRPQRIRFKQFGDLLVQVFFADVGLHTFARFVFLGATVINVALLNFGGDAASAAGTAKKTHEGFRFGFVFTWGIPPAFIYHRLHIIKQLLGDDRLVLAFMHLASIAKVSVKNRIGKQVGNGRIPQELAGSGTNFVFAEKDPHCLLRLVSSGIPFKRLFDNRGALTINFQFLTAVVVVVADGSGAGIFTSANFFTQTTFRVFGKRIHIVFAESEIIMKHELSLWSVFKPRTGEFERFDYFNIEHVDDPSGVHAVAGQTVGMPCENSIGFTGFNPCEHVVENRSARYFGRLFFNQLANNHNFFALGKLAQFIDLRVNGEDLLVLDIGGFSGVKKKFYHK